MDAYYTTRISCWKRSSRDSWTSLPLTRLPILITVRFWWKRLQSLRRLAWYMAWSFNTKAIFTLLRERLFRQNQILTNEVWWHDDGSLPYAFAWGFGYDGLWKICNWIRKMRMHGWICFLRWITLLIKQNCIYLLGKVRSSFYSWCYYSNFYH